MGYDYVRAETVNQALRAKASMGQSARFMAGGTDVMVLYRAGRLQFKSIISLRRVAELNQIKQYPDHIFLGAGVTLDQVLESPLLKKELPSLVEAVATMGCTQMRNLATVGGNVMSAVSSADTIPVLLSLGAQVRLASLDTDHLLDLDGFFTGPRATKAKAEELLMGFVIPINQGKAVAFSKLGRRKSLDLAVVNLAVWLSLDEKGRTVEKARISAGAVGPTPLMLKQAARALRGHQADKPLSGDILEAALADTLPWDDIRASAWYRRQVLKVLLQRTVLSAIKRAQTPPGAREAGK
ncbi:FAD binding domain-containing protein [Dethiosulfatarculus sandiegensis]|uniref:FAD-binding PCMH-type domain-containing protein n=1 Tax=Dethiosulfatarculus sandiegensis TaxID=1429043 RepID=A0A0D2JS91_9BACT|nr:FAD binding domain-containing protein [Dethiosulfatarculus sandiegensis]KIX12375.1 hypothetical protein X474_19435 [Dethiosulfatarculus sandiegensis]